MNAVVAKDKDRPTLILLADLYCLRTALEKKGWNTEPRHAPKNEVIEVIEWGSTGIHEGYRDSHGFWTHDRDDHDDYPCSQPLAWRKKE